MHPAKTTIVLYDGDCGFCNQSVQFILKNRKHNHFQFTPLQSDIAEQLLSGFHITINMETLYVIKNGKTYEKSSAILALINDLKNRYQFLKLGYLVPTFMRDGVYKLISKNRHKLKTGFCVIPTDGEKRLFKA
ncbi:MAG: DUF393 domain-containing protein [Putridiphycobacter sp.]|nr:DUF393 domain-containing protein [Putridiphycobacter sp.]